MLRYIPTTHTAGHALTQAIWQLHAVPGIGATQGFGSVISALDGSGEYLCIDSTESIRVHEEAGLDDIAAILQPWIDNGQLPPDTHAEMARLIDNLRGSQMIVYDAFPQLFKDMSLTTQEMIAAGKLPDPAILPT